MEKESEKGVDIFVYLEKEMATNSSILAWEIPRTEETVGHSPWSHKRVERD